jgi:hypothetical protein
VIAVIAWLFRNEMIAGLDLLVDAESDDAAALSDTEREQRTAEIQGDLLSVERDECSLIWQGLAQNLPVEFRNDCSPLAVLQCRLITMPRVVAMSGSSIEHSISFTGR